MVAYFILGGWINDYGLTKETAVYSPQKFKVQLIEEEEGDRGNKFEEYQNNNNTIELSHSFRFSCVTLSIQIQLSLAGSSFCVAYI